MAASSNLTVIVWEWMNEYGNWRPYDPHVSDFLETEYNSSSKNPVSMGKVDHSLSMYSADFTTMCQIRFGTGLYLFWLPFIRVVKCRCPIVIGLSVRADICRLEKGTNRGIACFPMNS